MGSDKECIVKEAYRQSDLSLSSEVSMALAADSRAMAFCGWMVASAALLAGLSKDSPTPALLVGAFFLLASAGVAGYSARPIEMRAPGTKYSDWTSDIEGDRAYVDALAEMGGHNDKQSTKNKAILRANGRLMWRAYVLAILGLGIPLTLNFPEIIDWLYGEIQ